MKYNNLDLGTIEAVFNKLGGMEGAQRFLRVGCNVTTKHIIDSDVQPVIPNGWSIEEHCKGGKLEWNPEKISHYLSDSQKTGTIVGNELRKELADKSVSILNACVLDYLLENPHLIPEEWKAKDLFFWGTVYRNAFGRLCVRCLCWNGTQWDSGRRCLGDDWNSTTSAACSQD